MIRNLRQAAKATKDEFNKTYEHKLEHLRLKYRQTEEEKLDKVPKEIEDYITLSIFDRDKFDHIEELTYEITCVGNMELSAEERSILRLHPKFSIAEKLQDEEQQFEQELSNAKLRMEINKELEKEESE